MKKLTDNKCVQLAIYIIITIIMALIIFPLFDIIYSVLTKSQFVYSVHEHIQRPAEMGLILGIVSWAVQNYMKKRSSKHE